MENILQWNLEKSTTTSADFFENLVRESARKMLAAVLESEVEDFIQKHQHKLDADGHRTVVRNGYMPEREIQATCGNIKVRQPRIDDRVLPDSERFTSSILPKFMRKTPTLENVIPTLYLKGISTNKFQDALTAIFGEGAKGFSPATITRLKEVWQKEYNEWAHRRLDGKEYVYVWADGVYCNARLDDQKLCLLVIIGVTVDGKKELVAVHQGVRESEESWLEVLRDLKFRGLTTAPKLAICDGALGFQNAVDKIWGQMKIQRCWFHKLFLRAIVYPSATSSTIIRLNPIIKRIVPQFECSPSDISGISSSMTTKIIAPAAKLKRYGRTGIISVERRIVRSPASGSTMPERTPYQHAFPLGRPFERSGMEIIAPSGKFWIAIPSASASAPASVMSAEPEAQPA